MQDFEKLKSEIINSTLKKIYRTKKPFTEFWFEGLGNLLSYKYVMELDNGKKYEFLYDYLCDWDESEKIVELQTDFQNGFQNKKITDVLTEGHEGIYFKMENDMILYHNNDFGSELAFEKSSELFDDSGKLI